MRSSAAAATPLASVAPPARVTSDAARSVGGADVDDVAHRDRLDAAAVALDEQPARVVDVDARCRRARAPACSTRTRRPRVTSRAT